MKVQSTSIRYIQMVMALPLGEWTSTGDVHKHLAALGANVSRRTVQRDLLHVSEVFGIEHRQDGHRRFYWKRNRSLEEAANDCPH